MKTILAFDVEVDETTSYVGTLSGKSYTQYSFDDFLECFKEKQNTIFVGFNSNDYKGYDLPMLIAYYYVVNGGTLQIPKLSKDVALRKINNPSKADNIKMLRHLISCFEQKNRIKDFPKTILPQLLNTIFFCYPNGNQQVRIPPHTIFGIPEVQYNSIKNLLIDIRAKKRGNYFYDLRDFVNYKSGSLKYLALKYFKIEYKQTKNKTDRDYNKLDLFVTTKLFTRPEHLEEVKSILYGQEYFDLHSPVINTQILVSQFVYRVLDKIDPDKIIDQNIIDLTAINKEFGKKINFLRTNKVNIPHKISLRQKDIYVPLTSGGIHYGEKNFYRGDLSKTDRYYYNIDFGSFYPSAYIQRVMFGRKNTEKLKALKEERLLLKKTNPAKANGLKLILNVLFGIVSKGGKSLFMTAISQWLIIEFLEQLDKVITITNVIDINTDGVIIETSEPMNTDDFYLHSALMGVEPKVSWDEPSDYVLETKQIEKYIYYKDYNNYMYDGKFKGAWVNDANINNNANMPHFSEILKLAFEGYEKEDLDPSLFRLIFKQEKLSFIHGDDLGYFYPSSIYEDSNGLMTYHCYSYKNLTPSNLSTYITEQDMINFIETVKFGFKDAEHKCFDSPYEVQVRNFISDNKDKKLIPVKYTKSKSLISQYKWIDDLNISKISSILKEDEFNEFIMMAISNSKSKPKWFMDLETESLIQMT